MPAVTRTDEGYLRGTAIVTRVAGVGTATRLNWLWDTPSKVNGRAIKCAVTFATASFNAGINGVVGTRQGGTSGGGIPVPKRLTLGDIIAGTRTWFGTKGSYQPLNATLSNAELAAITA